MQRYSNCSISFDLSFAWVRVYLFYPSVSLRSWKDCGSNFYAKNRKKWRIREGFSRFFENLLAKFKNLFLSDGRR